MGSLIIYKFYIDDDILTRKMDVYVNNGTRVCLLRDGIYWHDC